MHCWLAFGPWTDMAALGGYAPKSQRDKLLPLKFLAGDLGVPITTTSLGHRTSFVRTVCLPVKNQHPADIFGSQAVVIWLRSRPPCDLHDSVTARIPAVPAVRLTAGPVNPRSLLGKNFARPNPSLLLACPVAAPPRPHLGGLKLVTQFCHPTA